MAANIKIVKGEETNSCTVRQVYLKDNQSNKLMPYSEKQFSALEGAGTKRIAISRPQLIAWKKKEGISVALIFRDEERVNKISVAVTEDLYHNKWKLTDLDTVSVGSWGTQL